MIQSEFYFHSGLNYTEKTELIKKFFNEIYVRKGFDSFCYIETLLSFSPILFDMKVTHITKMEKMIEEIASCIERLSNLGMNKDNPDAEITFKFTCIKFLHTYPNVYPTLDFCKNYADGYVIYLVIPPKMYVEAHASIYTIFTTNKNTFNAISDVIEKENDGTKIVYSYDDRDAKYTGTFKESIEIIKTFLEELLSHTLYGSKIAAQVNKYETLLYDAITEPYNKEILSKIISPSYKELFKLKDPTKNGYVLYPKRLGGFISYLRPIILKSSYTKPIPSLETSEMNLEFVPNSCHDEYISELYCFGNFNRITYQETLLLDNNERNED